MNTDLFLACRRLLVMASAAFLAYLLVFTELTSKFFVWLIYRLMYVADTMFHECGHTIFGWVFGMPGIPAIFTLFGSDQAGGMTFMLDRSWIMQIFSLAMLAWGCRWVKRNYPPFFWIAIAGVATIAGLAFTRYYNVPVLYMGHGSSILVGGFFLFRAWEQNYTRNEYARWWNAYFGFFLVFDNMNMAYKLAASAEYRKEYASSTFGGAIDNDFVQIADIVWHWSVDGIAMFTVAYCVLALTVPAFLAWYLSEDEPLKVVSRNS